MNRDRTPSNTFAAEYATENQFGRGIVRSWASVLDDKTREQAEAISRVPIVDGPVALMPDAHFGYGPPVGSVILTRGGVMPYAVGVDIGCVDKDTEYLSPMGWRKISAYDGGLVMGYDPNTGEGRFTTPAAFINEPCGWFYHLKTKYGVDQMLSPEHRVLYAPHTRDGRYDRVEVSTAENVALVHERLALGFRGRFYTTFRPAVDTELTLSDAEIRVMVMVIADGHIPAEGTRCSLALRKARKITRARELLTAAGIAFLERVSPAGDYTTFRFTPPRVTKSYASFWPASVDQLTVVADECLYWDGNMTDRVFFTSVEESADFVQYAMTAAGYRSVKRVDPPRKGKVEYRVFAHTNTRVGIAGTPKSPIEIVASLDGRKYCFTMPTGYWVMRRGGVVAMTGNCGMSAVKLNIERRHIAGHEQDILDGIAAAIPSGVGTRHPGSTAFSARFFDTYGPPPGLSLLRADALETARLQFGTLGSGNHFVEVCEDMEDRVWLLLHSGSRGIGNQIATAHVALAQALCPVPVESREFAYLPSGTAEYEAYLADMSWAQTYALHQRAAMMSALTGVVRRYSSVETEIERVINCHHNYSELVADDLLLTRKGAINAASNRPGIIPGSMGAATYVVEGLGNAEAYHSSPHGAGRAKSRGEARRTLSADDMRALMAGRTWQADQAGALLDESPEAYKSIYRVMSDSISLVRPVNVLRQFISYKGVT